jgi:hypothetical protein
MAATNYRSYNNLITKAEVVSEVIPNSNFDTALIKDSTILIAEIAHLKSSLGNYFWGELRKGQQEGTLDANETALLNQYIKPCLAYYVKYEALNDTQYNMTSSGIVTNDDDFSIPVDDDEMGIVKEDVYRKAEILRRDLESWLSDSANQGVWSKYEDSDNSAESGGSGRIGGILAY